MTFGARHRPIHVDDRESAAAARGRLAMLLAACTDAALERMTAEGLAGTHRVPVKEAGAALEGARARRCANAV